MTADEIKQMLQHEAEQCQTESGKLILLSVLDAIEGKVSFTDPEPLHVTVDRLADDLGANSLPPAVKRTIRKLALLVQDLEADRKMWVAMDAAKTEQLLRRSG